MPTEHETALQKRKRILPTMDDIGVSKIDQAAYSLHDLIADLSTGRNSNTGQREREIGAAYQEACGHTSRASGVAIPPEILLRGVGRERTLTSVSLSGAGQSDTGQHLVPQEHLADRFVTALRDNAVLLNAGVTILPGLVGDVDIPAELTSPTFDWIAEDAEPSEGTYTLRNIALNFKTMAARVPYTRRVAKQSLPQFEDLLAANILRGMALGMELAIIEGASGSATEPEGILNTSGIGSVTTAGALGYSHIVEFLTDLQSANANPLEAEFLTNAGGMGDLLNATIESGDAKRVGEFVGSNLYASGRPVRLSNQVPANTLIFGIWRYVFLGLWGAPEIIVDTATKASTGGKVLRVFQDCDVAIVHAGAFSAATDL